MNLHTVDPLGAAMNSSASAAAPAPLSTAAAASYWQRSRRLSFALLAVWALATFGGIFFARELNFSFFGWPFSFWVAAQGLLLLYCAVVAYYAYAMRKLDEACGDQAKKDSSAAASSSG
jgi:putative solute:sodium symporter small subunit